MGDKLLYNRLPHRSIRVLTIQSARQPDAQIRGELSVLRLGDKARPNFSALSYVWGNNGDESFSILCAGIIVPVLPNLYSALYHLRNRLGTFTIWADAICINQEDDGEKEHQIPLMGEIYAESEYVYVWLGSGSMKTERAMEYLRQPPFMKDFNPAGLIEGTDVNPKLYSALSTYFLEGFRYKKTMFPKYLAAPSRSYRRNSGDVTFEDLATLLDTEWLERMWTYQEILLASSPILVCGQDHLPWPTFASAIAFLECSGYFHRDGRVGYPPASGWFKIALARDSLRYGNEFIIRSRADITKTRRNSPLWSYIEFIQAIVAYERRVILVAITVPMTTLLFLFIFVELIGVTDWVNYRRAQRNLVYAATYNQLISSMISHVIGEYPEGDHRASATTFQPSSSTAKWQTTITIPPTPRTETQVTTSIMGIITRLHESPWLDPTKVMDSAIEVMSTAVVSVVTSCRSYCTQHTASQGCFDSCTTSATSMPTLRNLPFEQADMIEHRSLSSYTSTFRGVLIYAVALVTIGTVAAVMREVRRNAIMQPVNQPSGLTVDLVDALLYRKAKLDHDKAFALRNILQKLSNAKIRQPDYGQPLDQTFDDLNYHLSQAIGYSKLLTVASIIPLTGHPSWMVDWSKRPDPFWTSNSRFGFKEFGSSQVLKAWLTECECCEGTVTLRRVLSCTVISICRVEHCFKFKPTNDIQDMVGHEHNLRTGLKLVRRSEDMLGVMHNCQTNLVALLRLEASGVSRADTTRWVKFLYDESHKPTVAMRLLMKKPKLLQTQMLICNQLSRNGRMLFLYKSDEEEETKVGRKGTRPFFRYVFGICRNTVQKDDVLVEVPGASTPLIVRMIQGKALLVSPAILKGERMTFQGRENVVFI